MQVAFRVDASRKIGTGHFMRCLTLADELKHRSAQIRFVVRHLPEHLRSMLTAKGHAYVLLDSAPNDATLDELAHAHCLGVSQTQDATDTIQALSDVSWDWLIVDHYALDTRWESMLRETARKIMVIDDIADRQHDCDILLDQNLYSNMETRYSGKVPAPCQLLLGPHYALLKEEFRTMREQVLPRNGPVERLLIFFGGVDIDNFTGHAIEALTGIGVPDLRVDVVVGASHPCRENIEAECMRHGFTCHVQTSQMAELMAKADLAIGAAGTATWERCCLGLPSVTVALADNQENSAGALSKDGRLLYLGASAHVSVEQIRATLKALLVNQNWIAFLSQSSMALVDGKGVLRVMRYLLSSELTLRQAEEADCEDLFQWRNADETRMFSSNQSPISHEEHERWYAKTLDNPSRVLLIGQFADQPVGVIRYDLDDSQAVVSIYLATGKHGRGYGMQLLRSGELWLVDHYPQIKSVIAEIYENNQASLNIFSEAGFKRNMSILKKSIDNG